MECCAADQPVRDCAYARIGFGQTSLQSGTERMGGGNGSSAVDFHNGAIAGVAQSDGVKVHIFTGERCDSVKWTQKAPIPGRDGIQTAISQKRCNGKADARSHYERIGCTVGRGEEAVVEKDTLWKPVMALRIGFMINNTDPVFGQGVNRPVVFLKGPDIMVHDGKNIFRDIID